MHQLVKGKKKQWEKLYISGNFGQYWLSHPDRRLASGVVLNTDTKPHKFVESTVNPRAIPTFVIQIKQRKDIPNPCASGGIPNKQEIQSVLKPEDFNIYLIRRKDDYFVEQEDEHGILKEIRVQREL